MSQVVVIEENRIPSPSADVSDLEESEIEGNQNNQQTIGKTEEAKDERSESNRNRRTPKVCECAN